MKKSTSLFYVGKNSEKESKNVWKITNQTFYSWNPSKQLPENLVFQIKNKKYSKVKHLIKKRIKKNNEKYSANFEWLKHEFLPYLQGEEKEIILRLNKIHNRKFPVKFVKIYFTSVGLSFYGKEKKGFWINMSGNPRDKDYWRQVLIHELMYLYFGIYFRKVCFDAGLSLSDTENIKESFTVLINEEFKDLTREKDTRFVEHKKIRKFLLTEWRKSKNFSKVLKSATKFYRSLK